MTHGAPEVEPNIVIHILARYVLMCVTAITIGTATIIQQRQIEYDLMPVGDPTSNPKRKTWAARCKEAKAMIASMFAISRGFTVDSGAADHVIPFGWIKFLEVLDSIGSRMGVTYIAASGTRIPNQGEQRVPFMTREGSWMEIVFQVAKINKPLLSVSKLIDGDMRVVFDKDRSYLYNKVTGDIVRIKRERGVFVLEAFSEFDPNKSARTRSGFRRHD
jgi:hypothetical protein